MTIYDNLLVNLLVGNYDMPPLEHMQLKAFYVAHGTLNGSGNLELPCWIFLNLFYSEFIIKKGFFTVLDGSCLFLTILVGK